MRGENKIKPLVKPLSNGTSPRARGKHRTPGTNLCTTRNIPACAGKTWHLRMVIQRPQEHPRVRGENTPMSCYMKIVSGTSPRARGKPPLGGSPGKILRNIPACAGKTTNTGQKIPPFSEHPRVRGENLGGKGVFQRFDGTSPRARGKLLRF